MSQRQLHLGAILTGVGTDPQDWLHPEIPGDASVNIDGYKQQARAAEAAKFDYEFTVDSPYITPDSAPHYLNRLEPLTLLSALAGATDKIGLVATLTTSYTEPFNVARQFASLDQISQGRAGWNVVITGLEGAAGNFGLEQQLDHGERYRKAREHVAVVQCPHPARSSGHRGAAQSAQRLRRRASTGCAIGLIASGASCCGAPSSLVGGPFVAGELTRAAWSRLIFAPLTAIPPPAKHVKIT